MRIILFSFITQIVLFVFFYFFPADIFEAEVKSPFATVTTDVSLQAILYGEDLPTELISENIVSVKPTAKGILILIVCLLALPVMIGYRLGMSKPTGE